MLWIVTGGVGCGKSAFAERWAAAHGREAIRLICPPWPSDEQAPDEAPHRFREPKERPQPHGGEAVTWTTFPADRLLTDRLNRINLQTNPFRADRKVVLLDSLSGWLRREVADARREGEDLDAGGSDFRRRQGRLEASVGRLLQALLDFQGRRIVVTEQASAGLAADPWERWFVRALAEANRTLVERCDGMHLLVSGMALEWKGVRTKRGNTSDENIYPERR